MYIWLASPKPSELFCPVGHPFLSSFAFFVSFIHSVAIMQPFSQRLTSHTSLGLMLLPICPVCCDSVATVTPSRGACRFGNYLLALAVLHDPISCRLFPHHLALRFQSLSLPFRFRQPASPVLQYVSLLAGIALCTSLGVCGRWRARNACSS
jgi:hypothetical protein